MGVLHPIRVQSRIRELFLKYEKAQRRQEPGGAEIYDSLEDPNTEDARNGLMALACEQQGTNGFAGAAQNEYGGEAHHGSLVNVPKAGRP